MNPLAPPDRDRVFDQHAAGVLVVAVVRDAGVEQVARQRREVDAQRPPRQQQVQIAHEETIEVRRVADDPAGEQVQPQRVPARHRPVERRVRDRLDERVAGSEQAVRRLQRQRDAHARARQDRIRTRVEIDAGGDGSQPAGAGLIMKSTPGAANALGSSAVSASSRKSRPTCRRWRKSLPMPSTPPARLTREATKLAGFGVGRPRPPRDRTRCRR